MDHAELSGVRAIPRGGALIRSRRDQTHPAIYEYAIRTYGLNPEETIYIDDLAANIATGSAMGMRTWQYDMKNHAPFEAWLDV
ncbi:MAG: HAD-IA family hydrolase [Luteolibacter sp.]